MRRQAPAAPPPSPPGLTRGPIPLSRRHREAERARRVAAAELAEGGERKRRGNWRDAHLTFQHSIKAARGDADAEPPPPVADPRVPCPHCGRKFQPDVAERHIPHCLKAAKRAHGALRAELHVKAAKQGSVLAMLFCADLHKRGGRGVSVASPRYCRVPFNFCPLLLLSFS